MNKHMNKHWALMVMALALGLVATGCSNKKLLNEQGKENSEHLEWLSDQWQGGAADVFGEELGIGEVLKDLESRTDRGG